MKSIQLTNQIEKKKKIPTSKNEKKYIFIHQFVLFLEVECINKFLITFVTLKKYLISSVIRVLFLFLKVEKYIDDYTIIKRKKFNDFFMISFHHFRISIREISSF